MTTYECLYCKERFKLKDKVQCPFCGSRIVKKPRQSIVKHIKAE
ncbi:MAG: DNA-directed RNA polymerase subunit P [Candidatus Aenigmatarchaeota archaeon]